MAFKNECYYVLLNQRNVDTDRVSAPEAVILKQASVSRAKVTEHCLIVCLLSLLPVSFSCLFPRHWLCPQAAGCPSDLLVDCAQDYSGKHTEFQTQFS